MTIENINFTAAIKNIRALIKKDKNISPALVAAIELILMINAILLNQKNLNSRNSSKPPSQDPNRPRKIPKDKEAKRKPGGQKGHKRSTLKKVDNPDKIKEILIDKGTFPSGNYTQVGFETRQVFNIKVSTHATEYRAEILENENGKQYVANFPDDVTRTTQYDT